MITFFFFQRYFKIALRACRVVYRRTNVWTVFRHLVNSKSKRHSKLLNQSQMGNKHTQLWTRTLKFFRCIAFLRRSWAENKWKESDTAWRCKKKRLNTFSYAYRIGAESHLLRFMSRDETRRRWWWWWWFRVNDIIRSNIYLRRFFVSASFVGRLAAEPDRHDKCGA